MGLFKKVKNFFFQGGVFFRAEYKWIISSLCISRLTSSPKSVMINQLTNYSSKPIISSQATLVDLVRYLSKRKRSNASSFGGKSAYLVPRILGLVSKPVLRQVGGHERRVVCVSIRGGDGFLGKELEKNLHAPEWLNEEDYIPSIYL